MEMDEMARGARGMKNNTMLRAREVSRAQRGFLDKPLGGESFSEEAVE